MQPGVGVILINFDSDHYTIACLESLKKASYSQLNIIVVDNGSKPESIAAVRSAYPQVTLMELGQNLGFTGGNNAGIRRALDEGADYIILLNNDTEVAPDMFDVLVDAMEQDPSIGVTGPLIYYYDQPQTLWSVAGTIHWQRGTSSMIGLNETDSGQYGQEPREADFVSGCALMARREVWERVGLLDDDFFLYNEETEWCVRAGRAGYKICYVPTARVWHKISIEQRAVSPLVYYYMTRNRLLLMKKTQASQRAWLYVLIEYARIFLSWTLRPKWRDRRHLRPVMLRAIGDYFSGRYGGSYRR